ncbi:MAG: hypothetical protein MUP90_18450, partial [Gammaproteobacteria bacterium]|nr:hypothetical protein [Gammaproteobacteria bacterium]
FPAKLWAANRFGEQDSITVVSGQFNNLGSVQRLFSSMVLEAVFAPVSSVDYAPPSILYAGSREVPGGLEFLVGASDEEGVARVLATYQDSPTSWTSVELDLVDGIWRKTVAGLTEDTQYFIQACDTSGNCTAKLDKNDYLVGSPPPQFVNRVGESHTFWVAVWKDEGNGLEPAVGVVPTVTLIDANGVSIPNNGWNGTCQTTGTDTSGKCSVTINSDQPGPISISASAQITVLTKILSRSTDGEIGNSLDATKIYVDGSLELGTSGSIEIGQPYTVTATLLKDVGGGIPVPAIGELANLTLTNSNGAAYTISSNTCSDVGTDASGQCTLTFTSASAGTVSVSGNALISVEGLEFQLTSNTVDVKFVDGEVSIATSTTKKVGESHPFIVTVTENNGDGVNAPVEGFVPTFNLPAGLQVDQQKSTCLVGTDVNGICTLIVTATEPGIYLVEVVVNHTTASGIVIERSSTATITYVAARVSVVPSSAVNSVGDQHLFTVTVETNDGAGWTPAVGLIADATSFTLAFTPTDPDTITNGCADPDTDQNGVCTVVINNASPGDFTLTVTVNTTVAAGEISIPVSASATGTKSYVAGSLTWFKVDQGGSALGGATFEACRITESDGVTSL